MIESGIKSAIQRNQVRLKRLVSVILWAGFFTLAYAQSPLYTSNQNQYFLHGLAQAGFGDLSQDWLANTLDPTPVFSSLVYLTYKLLFWPPLFYIYYGILAGIYLFSLFGIISTGLSIHFSKPQRWSYLALIVLLHSAVVRYMVVRVTNPDWVYLFDGGVAGQRLLGSVLQPSTFGVMLLFSIYLYLRGKIGWAVLSLVMAPIVHPTYLLSAAILTLVFMGITYYETRKIWSALRIGGAALIGVVPTLIHTYMTFVGSDPSTSARARELLVTFRIPHHAISSAWFDGSVIVKLGFVVLALGLSRKTRLFHILLWPTLLVIIGSVAQLITQSNVLALLFPWRMSTWLVPISVAIITIKILESKWSWIEKRVSRGVLMAISLMLAIGLAGGGLVKTLGDGHAKRGVNDRPMMAYVANHKTPGSVYLIPLDMQDFRLETGAPAYIEFKSIPYKDIEVLEWYRRVRTAGNLYRAPIKRTGCEMLSELYLEGVTNVVLPYDHTIKTCPNLIEQYMDGSYQVFQLVGDG
jgi:hypothetical protein